MPAGVVFLDSYFNAIRPLPDEDRLRMYDAVFDFGLRGIEPELPPLLAGYFTLIRPNIEASMRRYEAAVENGKKGGRPSKGTPAKNQSKNQNKNQSGNLDKEKDKEIDKEFDMEKDDEDENQPSPRPPLTPEQEFENRRRDATRSVMGWNPLD